MRKKTWILSLATSSYEKRLRGYKARRGRAICALETFGGCFC
jgi:hypothetical protein